MGNGDKAPTVRVETIGFGGIWFIGWLFTIGFAHLPLVQAAIGIVLWPYFLGVAVR